MYKFTKENVSNILNNPGIYKFYNNQELLIYIGKSVNLRNRLRTYFSIKSYDDAKFFDDPEQKTILKKSIFYFEVEYQETELEALLLEDKLIKENWPEYNIKQKEFIDYKYIVLVKEDFSYFKIVDNITDENDEIAFGPFRDIFFIQEIINLLGIYFGIRVCTEKTPLKKCLRFDLKQCSGPCRKMIAKKNYELIVNQVLDLFKGNFEYLVQCLKEKMIEYSHKMEYEKAQKILNDMRFFESFTEKQRFIDRFRKQFLILSLERGIFFLFAKGKFLGKYRDYDFAFKKIDKDKIYLSEDEKIIIDIAYIVHSWINKNRTLCKYEFFF